MFFRNLEIKYNKYINLIAGTIFGVLQIHANSDAMRTWLWGDVLKNDIVYFSEWLMIHSFGSVIGVFLICSIIDLLREKFIENPMLRLLDTWRNCKKVDN